MQTESTKCYNKPTLLLVPLVFIMVVVVEVSGVGIEPPIFFRVVVVKTYGVVLVPLVLIMVVVVEVSCVGIEPPIFFRVVVVKTSGVATSTTSFHHGCGC